MWKPRGSFELYSKPKGFFLVQFVNPLDKEVLNLGPKWYDNRQIVVKERNHTDDFKSDLLTDVPL